MSIVASETLDAMCNVCSVQGATMSMKPLEVWSGSVTLV